MLRGNIRVLHKHHFCGVRTKHRLADVVQTVELMEGFELKNVGICIRYPGCRVYQAVCFLLCDDCLQVGCADMVSRIYLFLDMGEPGGLTLVQIIPMLVDIPIRRTVRQCVSVQILWVMCPLRFSLHVFNIGLSRCFTNVSSVFEGQRLFGNTYSSLIEEKGQDTHGPV